MLQRAILGRHADLSMEHIEDLEQICHALSSSVRLDILRLLSKQSRNVRELSELLNVPMSTAALGVKILEEAGLINSETQKGIRGAMKLCSLAVDTIGINLIAKPEANGHCLSISLPVGSYCLAEDIAPSCGLAGEHAYIGGADEVSSFYSPNRFDAQLIWFRRGFLEYRFSVRDLAAVQPSWLEVSFESCSEAPMYRDPWESDIALEINGKRLGLWTSPCDCGGRRGALTPSWWSDLNTQFGFLKTWRVDESGCYLDKERIGNLTVKDLALGASPYVSIRIGVPADAKHVGGLNLFGTHFGDHPQEILIRLGYESK